MNDALQKLVSLAQSIECCQRDLMEMERPDAMIVYRIIGCERLKHAPTVSLEAGASRYADDKWDAELMASMRILLKARLDKMTEDFRSLARTL